MRLRWTIWTLLVAVGLATLGCASAPHHAHNLPPAQQLLEPGPGVGGPGPGVIPPTLPTMPAGHFAVARPTVQIMFSKPNGMQVRWDTTGAGQFDSSPLVVPGRNNFPQNGIYRLKITNITGREGAELYPTLEVGPTTGRTEAFLAHNAIPVQFTEEDFDQVMTGNMVTKVIYLPDPEFQGLALTGVETLVSTRLDPGENPIKTADDRGSIMAVVRLGNKDVEMSGLGFQAGPGVVPASHGQVVGGGGGVVGGPIPPGAVGMPGMPGMPGMMPASMGPAYVGPTGVIPNYVSGLTAPQWGMPYVGTPIGLPGPPHIPLGHPAGLTRHVIKNHTKVHMPSPTGKVKIHVKQQPGYSYPAPPNRVWIREQNIHTPTWYGQPKHNKHQRVP